MRYYSAQRPIVPGGYPKPEGNAVTEIMNFEQQIFCEEINQDVWGYICYEGPLSREQQSAYEFIISEVDWQVWVRDKTLDILSAQSVHESGQMLEAFIDALEEAGKPEQHTALEKFWEILRGTSFVNEDFGAEDNHGWAVCPPEKAVATYLGLELERQDSVAEDLDYMKRCARQFREQFLPTGGCGTNAKFFSRVMEYLDKKYGLSSYLFQDQRAVAVFLQERYQDGPVATFCQYNSKLGKFTYHFAFMDASGFASLFLNISPAFYIIDAFAAVITTCAFCTVDDRTEDVSNSFVFPQEILNCLEESAYLKRSKERQREKVKQAIRDAILSESPFLYETARAAILRSGAPERKKVLEAALKRLAESDGEKDAEECHPEGG